MDTDTTRLDAGGAPAATAEVLDGLNDLLQLDHDAVGAYDVAIEKLEDRDHADQIAGFRRDHERHIRELNELIAELGGTPANEPHATGPLKKALQTLGGLAGDKGVLMAFRTNELQVRAKYDAYAAKANLWPDRVKRTVDRAALDEERHYTWVAEVLQRLGVGSGEGAEVDLMNRARERSAAGEGALDHARDRVADAAGEVRERVSGGVEAVRNRISGMLDTDSGAAGAVRDRVETAAGGVRHAAAGLEDRVREHPVQTLLIAGVAGFLLGRIIR